MTRKIKYEIKTNFNYSHVTVEVESVDGDLITPEELDRILAQSVNDYSELDLGAGVH